MSTLLVVFILVGLYLALKLVFIFLNDASLLFKQDRHREVIAVFIVYFALQLALCFTLIKLVKLVKLVE